MLKQYIKCTTPHQVGSDQQRYQHNVNYTQTITRSLHRSWHGACQRHLSERSHLVVAFLYCQFTIEGLDIIKILNIHEHKNHTEHLSHNTLFHSNITTTAMVHNAVPTQLNTKYNSYVSTNIPSFMRTAKMHNHLHHTLCILQYFNNNNKTLQQATKCNVK